MSWLRIFRRNEWGARYGTGWGARPLPVPTAWLHHSVTGAPPVTATFEQDASAVRTLDQIGYDRFKFADAGFTRPKGAGISYTWAVPPSGRVFEGHDPKLQSSHTSGYNYNGVGIVLIGNYDNDTPTPKQIEAVARLLLQARDDGIIATAQLTGGHRDVYATACPGKNAYPLIAEINKMVKTIEAGGKDMPVDTNKGFSVAYIKEVQTILKKIGYYSGDISGNLLDVDDSVRAFQGANDLYVDGLPGNNTMSVARTRLAEYEERLAREKAEEDARLAREKAIAETVAKARLTGPNRWRTAYAAAITPLPAGRGMLIAADGSPDERYATARAGGEVIYMPVRANEDVVPGDTLGAVKAFKPQWVLFVGGLVTDKAARSILETAGLI